MLYGIRRDTGKTLAHGPEGYEWATETTDPVLFDEHAEAEVWARRYETEHREPVRPYKVEEA